MKFILALSAVTMLSMASAQPSLPTCVIDNDTTACTTPFGEPGYFICPVFPEGTLTNLRPTEGTMTKQGMMGRRRGRGKHLTSSKCVPVDRPERPELPIDGEGPFGDGDGDGPFGGNRHMPTLECGCCDDVCPPSLEDCGCSCDITLPYSTIMKGVKATVVKPDGTTVTKCLPPAYADADKATCIVDCAAEVVESRVPFN